jgi:zinc protease
MARSLPRITVGPLTASILVWAAVSCGVPALAAPGPAPAAPATKAPSAGTPLLPHGVTPVTSVEGIDEYALVNGMRVLMLEDSSKPTTTVNMTVKVGSRYEHYGETGMAHLLEHMMFKGTPHHSGVMAEFQNRGFDFNGTTAEDRTNYFASMAQNDTNLDWYLRWLADALVNSNVARKDLDSEMTVVRNEMESGENNPSTVLYQKTLAAA